MQNRRIVIELQILKFKRPPHHTTELSWLKSLSPPGAFPQHRAVSWDGCDLRDAGKRRKFGGYSGTDGLKPN